MIDLKNFFDDIHEPLDMRVNRRLGYNLHYWIQDILVYYFNDKYFNDKPIKIYDFMRLYRIYQWNKHIFKRRIGEYADKLEELFKYIQEIKEGMRRRFIEASHFLDLVILYNGKCYVIELKTFNSKPSKYQAMVLSKAEELGLNPVYIHVKIKREIETVIDVSRWTASSS